MAKLQQTGVAFVSTVIVTVLISCISWSMYQTYLINGRVAAIEAQLSTLRDPRSSGDASSSKMPSEIASGDNSIGVNAGTSVGNVAAGDIINMGEPHGRFLKSLTHNLLDEGVKSKAVLSVKKSSQQEWYDNMFDYSYKGKDLSKEELQEYESGKQLAEKMMKAYGNDKDCYIDYEIINTLSRDIGPLTIFIGIYGQDNKRLGSVTASEQLVGTHETILGRYKIDPSHLSFDIGQPNLTVKVNAIFDLRNSE